MCLAAPTLINMGVCCIVLWSYPDNLNTSQALEFLQNRLKLLGSTLVGNWVVDCEVLQSTAATATNTQGKSVYFIHSSEYPRSTFTVLDPSYTCLVADNTLDSIFAHLKPFYTPRKGLRIESRGYRHEVKEKYVVKFASVTFSATSKAVIVEIENRDDSTVSSAWGPLTEFTKALLHTSEQIQIPEHVQKSLDGRYAPADSMVQYAHIFNQIRKTGGK